MKDKKPFITRVNHPAKLPDMDTLNKCRQGLTKKIKATKKPENKQRLKDIRDEIDFLIDAL